MRLIFEEIDSSLFFGQPASQPFSLAYQKDKGQDG
jgi:hypothetical protein